MKILTVLVASVAAGIALGGLIYLLWTSVASEKKLKRKMKDYPKPGKRNEFRYDNRISKQIILDDFENRLS